jgi:hypothetical protein
MARREAPAVVLRDRGAIGLRLSARHPLSLAVSTPASGFGVPMSFVMPAKGSGYAGPMTGSGGHPVPRAVGEFDDGSMGRRLLDSRLRGNDETESANGEGERMSETRNHTSAPPLWGSGRACRTRGEG